jgi:ethanolamine utilization protein EutS
MSWETSVLNHTLLQTRPILYTTLEIQDAGASGILILTPIETSITAADVAPKAAEVQLGFLDRLQVD